MKLSIALFALCVLHGARRTHAKPGLLAPVLLTSSQYHSQDQLGQYSYGYANPQSAKAEVKTADGVTQGSYSYVDAEGKLQSVHYTSDEINGFRVAATNLPTPVLPLVAIAQQDNLEAIAIKAKLQQAKLEPGQQEQLIQFQEHDQQEPANAAVRTTAEDRVQVQQVQVRPLLKTSVLTYASPLVQLAAPGFAYSYGYAYPQYSYVNHLTPITAYAATPYIATQQISPANQAPQLPAAPTETPEVAKARAEHIKAHDEAKARNL